MEGVTSPNVKTGLNYYESTVPICTISTDLKKCYSTRLRFLCNDLWT